MLIVYHWTLGLEVPAWKLLLVCRLKGVDYDLAS